MKEGRACCSPFFHPSPRTQTYSFVVMTPIPLISGLCPYDLHIDPNTVADEGYTVTRTVVNDQSSPYTWIYTVAPAN